MRSLIRIVRVALIAARYVPSPFATDQEFGLGSIEIHDAASAMGTFSYLVRATRNLPALAEHLGAVGIRIFNSMMVEDVPVFLTGTHLTAAHSLCFRGMTIFDTISTVQIVNVFLADVVATKPRE